MVVLCSLSTGLLWWCIPYPLGSALPPHTCPTISIILNRPWLLCNELGSEMSLDHTRNPCTAKVEWYCSYQGHVLSDQGGQ